MSNFRALFLNFKHFFKNSLVWTTFWEFFQRNRDMPNVWVGGRGLHRSCIDDVFIVWTHTCSRRPIQTFISYLNNLHPTIKFTSSHSSTFIPFLDFMVSLNHGVLTTNLCTKPTAKHQYLSRSPSHSLHTKRAIPFSLALRLRRICFQSCYVLINLCNIPTNMATISLFSNKKYNVFTLYNAIQLLSLAPIPLTRRVLSLLLSSITLPLVFSIYHKKALSHSRFFQTMYRNIHITTPSCFQTF